MFNKEINIILREVASVVHMSLIEVSNLLGYLNELWWRHPFVNISTVRDHALREEELREEEVH